MRVNKVEMRRSICRLLCDRLAEKYGIDVQRSDQGQPLTAHEIDSLLAFRSDQRLEDLRRALNRLEDGTYGRCLCCKGLIEPQLLGVDPARRVCSRCEQRFFHPARIREAEKKYFAP